MEVLTAANDKGLLSRAKDLVIERLKGAEQTALDAITSTQNDAIAEIKAANDSVKATSQQMLELAKKASEALTSAQGGSGRIAELS